MALPKIDSAGVTQTFALFPDPHANVCAFNGGTMKMKDATLDRRGNRRRAAAVLFPTMMALCTPAMYAQFRASITGTVKDPTGAGVPGAKITLVDIATGRTLTATSNATGAYTFNALPPDQFNLTVTMTGFQTKTINALQITPEQANNVDLNLAVGGADTTVSVNADTVPPLETATASISGTVSANDIQHLPSAGRDVFQLAQLTPGSFGDGQRGGGGGTSNLPGTQGPGGSSNTQGVFATENGPQTLANGGQYETNSISIDGINTVSAVWGGTTVITPNEDSIDNVKITSNGYDAEFGRFSGANMQVTTKSGTNQVHGSFFFRVARPGLNAFQRYNGPASMLPAPLDPAVANNNVNRAAARGLLRDTARYNDFGGSIGGPVLKNRLFAFFAYETIRNNSTVTSNHWYETDAFDALAPTGYISNKYTTFAGHTPVGKTLINSTCNTAGLIEGVNCHTIQGVGLDIGKPLLTARGTQDPSYISNTNPGVGGGLDLTADIANYQTATPSSVTQVQYNGRLDADVTQKDHLAFAIYWQPASQQSINGPARGYNLWNHNQTNDAFSVIYNHTFSPTLLNEARANAAGWRWNEVTDNPQAPFGLPTATVNLPGGTDLQPFGASGPTHLNQWTFGYKDVATKIAGNHTIKFGGEATQLHYLQDPVAAARPSFNFYNIWNFLNDAPYSESGTFNRFTGTPFSNRFDMREWIYGAFVQDDWKATPNLTLTAGVRYNYFDALYSKQNNLPRVQFGQGSATFTGINLIRGGKAWDPDKLNLGPQVGFAYNPDIFKKRVVLRGGFGLNFNQEEIAISANTSFNPNDAVSPAFNSSTPTVADPRIQYNVPSDSKSLFGYPANSNTITSYGPNGLPTTGGFSLTTLPNRLRTQQVPHYSLDVQGDLGHQMVATVTYQGSTGHHLIYHQNLYVRGQYLGYAINPQTPFIENFGDGGNSNYNAMIIDLKHTMSHNFMFDASFTYSKSMDDNSSPYNEDPYPYQPYFNRGRSDFNFGKALKIYGLYTPKLYYGSNAFGKVLLNGFNISGIYNLHTGFPWTPVRQYGTNAYYTGSGYGTLRPTSYTGTAGHDHSNKAFIAANGPSPNFAGGGTNYFGAYSQTQISATSTNFPAPITFYPRPGIARNSFDGPGYQALDMTVTKAFGVPNRYLGERTGIEFRVDAFNVLNITNLASGSGGAGIVNEITNQQFGIAASGLAGRQVQIQARLSF
jgi:hypothetical protein